MSKLNNEDNEYTYVEVRQNNHSNSDYGKIISYLIERTDKIEKELKSFKSSFTKVKDKQSELKSENRELERENKKLKSEIDDLKTELKDLNSFKKDSKFGQYSNLMEQIRDLHFLNKTLKIENKAR